MPQADEEEGVQEEEEKDEDDKNDEEEEGSLQELQSATTSASCAPTHVANCNKCVDTGTGRVKPRPLLVKVSLQAPCLPPHPHPPTTLLLSEPNGPKGVLSGASRLQLDHDYEN